MIYEFLEALKKIDDEGYLTEEEEARKNGN